MIVRPVFAVLLAATLPAAGQEATRYRMHDAYIACRIGPCASWEVVDVTTGETFYAVVTLPPGTAHHDGEYVVEAIRSHEVKGGSIPYERLTITTIVSAP